MAIFLDRIDSAPISDSDFDHQFLQWIWVLVDTLNESILKIQDAINGFDDGLVAPSFTTAQITALAVTAANGTMWYDSTTNELKAKVNGVVVVIA